MYICCKEQNMKKPILKCIRLHKMYSLSHLGLTSKFRVQSEGFILGIISLCLLIWLERGLCGFADIQMSIYWYSTICSKVDSNTRYFCISGRLCFEIRDSTQSRTNVEENLMIMAFINLSYEHLVASVSNISW